ncbi:MAG: RNA polymerase subunit sigma-24 [Gemmatimonadetes bacterium]|nr:MAG: RNA polymerase subunit sigma-24 [Gemmatimonadota bacterium]
MLSPRTPPAVTAGSELPPLAVPITSPRPDEDAELVDGLKCRDEAAFVTLLERYQGQLLRLALVYCRTKDIAEEIVQDTWLAVIQGIDRFEGRATFKTWLFQILVNRARTRAVKEGRSLSFSSITDEAEMPGEPAVPPERFRAADDPWPNHWALPPHSWGESSDARLLAAETMDLVNRAIAQLPPAQQQVITLRDIEGWTSEVVCNVLEISETNQRVLLHRARSRVRAALEAHFDER